LSKKYRIVRFKKTEFQDTGADDKPDETRLIDENGNEGPYKYGISTKYYFSRKAVREAYDTKYLRTDLTRSQEQYARRVDLEGVDYPLTEEELDRLFPVDTIE